MLFTAYCIHTSEGVPVRRILQTKFDGESTLAVIQEECDWNWERKTKQAMTWAVTLPKAKGIMKLLPDHDREMAYHKKFRKQMSSEHNWRFEVYWPLSSLDV